MRCPGALPPSAFLINPPVLVHRSRVRLSVPVGWHHTRAEDSLPIPDAPLTSWCPPFLCPGSLRMPLRRLWTCTRNCTVGMSVSLWLRPRYYQFCRLHGAHRSVPPISEASSYQGGYRSWNRVGLGVGTLVTGMLSVVTVGLEKLGKQHRKEGGDLSCLSCMSRSTQPWRSCTAVTTSG